MVRFAVFAALSAIATISEITFVAVRFMKSAIAIVSVRIFVCSPVSCVATLSTARLQERGGRILQLVSGAVLAALGLALLFKPEWLS